MDLIEIVSSVSATSPIVFDASIILLVLIPFIVVGFVVVTVFFMRLRQKRRMRDVK